MDSFRTVRLEERDRIAEIVLARPPLNILTVEVMGEIGRALGETTLAGSARVVLLRSEGPHFSAGADIQEHLPERAAEMLEALGALFLALGSFEPPLVAAVQGACLGGGMELAMACDLVVAAQDARFGQPEVRVGAIAPIAAVQLPGLVGHRRAAEILLSGRELTAAEAREMGLVNEVVPKGEVASRARAVAERIAAFSGPVLAAAKRALLSKRGLAETLDIYRKEILPLDDAREGLRAFLEKREPKWTDR